MINYPDEVTLVIAGHGLYGQPYIQEQETVSAAVELNTGYIHGGNQDVVNSDAVMFLDPEDQFTIDNHHRLEEMYVIIDLFDTPERRSWYKITSVDVVKGHQLCNEIDHIEVRLKKSAEIPNALS